MPHAVVEMLDKWCVLICSMFLSPAPVLWKHIKSFIEEETQHTQCPADVILFCTPEGLVHSLFHSLFCFLGVLFAVTSTVLYHWQKDFRLYLGAAPYNSSCHFLSPLQDEQSAVSMLKKHQILEQAVEDYAETVHQLSKTSRTLVADNHPERY